MKIFPKLPKAELQCINKLDKIQHRVEMEDFEKHAAFIYNYCMENNLKSLSFNRTKKGINTDCSFYNPLDFMTPAQRRNVEKQIEEAKL